MIHCFSVGFFLCFGKLHLIQIKTGYLIITSITTERNKWHRYPLDKYKLSAKKAALSSKVKQLKYSSAPLFGEETVSSKMFAECLAQQAL